MTSSAISWIDRGLVGPTEIDSAVTSFEQSSGAELHWIARHHLVEGSGRADDPFPRVEEHSGYLFGILYVPSNPGDIFAEFDELVFAATHDSVIGTFSRSPRSTADWPTIFESLSSDHVFRDSDETGGRVLVRMLKTVIKRLIVDAENFTQAVDDIASDLGFSLDHVDTDAAVEELRKLTRHERRRIRHRVSLVRDRIAAQRKEVPLMSRVVAETESILERLADDRLDLGTDVNGAPRQLFTRELEIFLADTHVDARHVSSLMSDIEYRLSMIRDYLKQLKDEENVAANRFTGAIASIMLLPTFIVGLYGQNFGRMPELEWRFGYLFSWLVILTVTVGQIWFFRRRKWI